MMRLDKLLSQSGFGTRSEVKNLIKKKRVIVDNNIVMSPDIKVDPDKNTILIDGKPLFYEEYRYYMLHKPAGVVTATTDSLNKTVLDLLEGINKKDLSPVGRLDKDTEGLLLITNDGMLSHKLLSPTKHVAKTYYVEVDISITDDIVASIEAGVDILDEKPTLPCKLEATDDTHLHFNITIVEGRYHQIKRMFRAHGATVTYLKRLSMGSLLLDSTLPVGSFRPLTAEEIDALKGDRGCDDNISPDKAMIKPATSLLTAILAKKAVLFDLDGTIIDSMWMWKAIDIEYLGRFGIQLPDNLQQEIEGKSFHETAIYFKERFELKDSLDQIKEDWNFMANTIYKTRVTLKAGVLNFLKLLKANNIKTAITTSNSPELTATVLEALHIRDYFDLVITACQVGKGKPNPDIYLAAAKELDVSPADCVVFEDVPQGIMAGKNAEMLTIAVEDEYSNKLKEEKRTLSDYYITGFDCFFSQEA